MLNPRYNSDKVRLLREPEINGILLMKKEDNLSWSILLNQSWLKLYARLLSSQRL